MGGSTYAVHLAAEAIDVPRFGGIVALACAVGALFAIGVLWRSSAARRVAPGPATMELRDETPALVDLLTGGFRVEDDAVPATVVDLAQRGHLSIEELGGRVTIRLRRHGSHVDEPLTDYEQRVLDHIERKAHDGVVPAEVLTIGPQGVSARWFAGFVREVNQHGRSLGLCHRRFDLAHLAMAWGIVAVGVAPAWIIAAAAPRTPDPRGWGTLGNLLLGVAVIVGFGLVWVAQKVSRSTAQRDTEAGRAAAAHWLGVRDHYRSIGDFEAKPAASVAVWDRHLAYATAMGLAPEVQRQLPFETEHDRHAWSRATGEWRRIRIRYQSFVPGWGEHPGRLAFDGLVQAVATGFLAFLGLALARADLDVDGITDDQRRWAGLAGIVIAALAAAVCLFALVKLVLGLSDLFARRTVEGEVVRARRLRTGHRLPKVVQWALWSGRDEHGMSRGRDRTTRHHLAIDDGDDDSIVAYVARPDVYAAAPQGARVRAVVTPRIGYVRSVDVLAAPPPSAAPESADVHPLVEEAASRATDRLSGSIGHALGQLERAADENGRPFLDQTDGEGVSLRERLAEASAQLDDVRNDPRVRDSPIGGMLDALLSEQDDRGASRREPPPNGSSSG